MFYTFKIYSIIFKAINATLKLESASSFIKIGKNVFARDYSSELYWFVRNFDCSSSIAYKRIFQSFSFFKSSISFLPTFTSFFYVLLAFTLF